ncbi:MAG: hypothetical protein AAF702_05915 [Chloroflexota bacterium]
MSKTEMFQALHPDPEKQGTRVTKKTYEIYRDALLKVIPESQEGIEFALLSKAVVPYLSSNILDQTSPGWWTTTVKLDLEARGMIERVPGRGRQKVRRITQ